MNVETLPYATVVHHARKAHGSCPNCYGEAINGTLGRWKYACAGHHDAIDEAIIDFYKSLDVRHVAQKESR